MNNDHDLIEMKLGLDEVKASFDLAIDSIGELDSKARSLLSAASIVIAITSVFKLSDLISDPISLKGLAMVIILLLYLLLVRTVTSGIKPIKIKAPIEPKFELYKSWFFERTEKNIYEWLIKGYINCTNYAAKAATEKSKYVDRSVNLLVLIVAILLVVPFLPS